MILPAPLTTNTYRVFLSSGADVVVLRDRTEKLCEIASEALSRHDRSSRIEVDRWEDSPPHITPPEEHLNAEFVRRALNSQFVVALLCAEIRPGTLEELEAVLEKGTIEVALFCFESPDPRSDQLEDFLDKWNHRILYKEVGPPNSGDAWYELVRSVVDLTLRVILHEGKAEAYIDQY